MSKAAVYINCAYCEKSFKRDHLKRKLCSPKCQYLYLIGRKQNRKRRPILIQSSCAFILLTQNKVATIDRCDIERVSQHSWSTKLDKSKSINQYYAVASNTVKGRKTSILLHRFIMNITSSSIIIDHIDGNGLNNCKNNLRECTNSQNSMNRGPQINSTSGYKGVSYDREAKKWVAQININGIRQTKLGRFASKEEAARAYDEAAKIHHGEFARLNFPN